MSKLDITIYDLFGEKGDSAYVLVDIKKINNYINLAKALESEHEALNLKSQERDRDIARFIELLDKPKNISSQEGYNEQQFFDGMEYFELREKLSKVGKEE